MGKGEASDFQGYNIRRFKCLVFNNKIIRHTKKQESMVLSKINKSTETVPQEDLIAKT